LLKVALDIHPILMLNNKIYKYLASEIFKNFLTILLTFTAIAWTVRAVNFLDLMIEDGFNAIVYFKYSLLNISTIVTRFIPLSFLLSIVICILKFERQQELMILWTAGINKIKILNIFFLISVLVTLLGLILSLIINPFLLHQSRFLLKNTELKQVNAVLKSNDFSDAFQGITFYIDKKKINNKLSNIFIKDVSNSLLISDTDNASKKNTTITARSGYFKNNKLILFDGSIQTLNIKNEIKNFDFKQTELSVGNFHTRTIMQPKMQETSSYILMQCLTTKNIDKKMQNCLYSDNKKEVVQTLSRRIGVPLYVPLIAVIASFLLIYKKEEKFNYLKKYFVFTFAFLILVFSEILVKFTGFSLAGAIIYFLTPFVLFAVFYLLLVKKFLSERTA